MAPFKAHLLDITTEAKGHRQAQVFYETLLKLGLEVLFDDRLQVPAGSKFADADLIGCPYRLVVSDRTIEQESFEIKRRRDTEGRLVNFDQVDTYFKSN